MGFVRVSFPPAVIVLGLIIEPGFDRLGIGWWRCVADPSCKLRHTVRPLAQAFQIVSCVPFGFPTPGIVRDARHPNRRNIP